MSVVLRIVNGFVSARLANLDGNDFQKSEAMGFCSDRWESYSSRKTLKDENVCVKLLPREREISPGKNSRAQLCQVIAEREGCGLVHITEL